MMELVFIDESSKTVTFAIARVTRIFALNEKGIRYETDGDGKNKFVDFNRDEKLEVRING